MLFFPSLVDVCSSGAEANEDVMAELAELAERAELAELVAVLNGSVALSFKRLPVYIGYVGWAIV